MSYLTANEVAYVISAAVVVGLLTFKLFTRIFSAKQKEKASAGVQQVYVGNLSYRVRERELRDFFNSFGDISQINIIKNRNTGRSKGFGFVTFSCGQGAKKALQAHGDDFEGRSLVVRIANPR